MSRTRLGLALDDNAIWAIEIDRRGRPLDNARHRMEPIVALDAAALEAAFARVSQDIGQGPAIVHVTILPPLAQGRTLDLPRVTPDELRRVLTRNASRYFLRARDTCVVGAAPLPGQRGSPARVFATAAPVAVVEAILRAADAVGWTVDSIVSAYDAWAHAVDDGFVVLIQHDRVEVLRLREGRPVLVRRFLCSFGGDQAVADLLADSDMSAVRVLAAEPEQGVPAERFGAPGNTDSAAIVAAGCAALVDGPELLPERIHAARRRRTRSLTRTLGLAAAATLVVAAGLVLWGMERELDAVRDQRAAVRAEVAQTMAQRDEVLGLADRLRGLAELEASAVRWSRTIGTLASRLPRSAYLTKLEGTADSVLLTGAGTRAADVLAALTDAPEILAVRARAPIRRELRDGEDATERFALTTVVGPGQEER